MSHWKCNSKCAGEKARKEEPLLAAARDGGSRDGGSGDGG